MPKPRRETDSQQLIALLREVLAIANRLSTRERTSSARVHKGIFPHQSKYNPWRAYWWDKAKQKTIYLGAFPSLARARAAQRAYDSGKPVLAGPQAAALRVVAK